MGFFCRILRYCVTITAIYYVSQIQAEELCCECTYTSPNVTPESIIQIYSNLVKEVWNRVECTQYLSCLGTRFRNKILQYVDIEDSPVLRLIVMMSYSYHIAAPFAGYKPDKCFMGQVLNASALQVNGIDDDMEESLIVYGERMNTDIFLMSIISRYASGCDGWSCNPSLNPMIIPTEICEHGGFDYDIHALWDRPEIVNIPELIELRGLVLEMYESEDYYDRLLAMLTTYAITPSFARIFSLTNPKLIIEAMTLEMSPPIQQCCCYQRIKRIDDLYTEYAKEIDLQVFNEIERIFAWK